MTCPRVWCPVGQVYSATYKVLKPGRICACEGTVSCRDEPHRPNVFYNMGYREVNKPDITAACQQSYFQCQNGLTFSKADWTTYGTCYGARRNAALRKRRAVEADLLVITNTSITFPGENAYTRNCTGRAEYKPRRCVTSENYASWNTSTPFISSRDNSRYNSVGCMWESHYPLLYMQLTVTRDADQTLGVIHDRNTTVIFPMVSRGSVSYFTAERAFDFVEFYIRQGLISAVDLRIIVCERTSSVVQPTVPIPVYYIPERQLNQTLNFSQPAYKACGVQINFTANFVEQNCTLVSTLAPNRRFIMNVTHNFTYCFPQNVLQAYAIVVVKCHSADKAFSYDGQVDPGGGKACFELHKWFFVYYLYNVLYPDHCDKAYIIEVALWCSLATIKLITIVLVCVYRCGTLKHWVRARISYRKTIKAKKIETKAEKEKLWNGHYAFTPSTAKCTTHVLFYMLSIGVMTFVVTSLVYLIGFIIKGATAAPVNNSGSQLGLFQAMDEVYVGPGDLFELQYVGDVSGIPSHEITVQNVVSAIYFVCTVLMLTVIGFTVVKIKYLVTLLALQAGIKGALGITPIGSVDPRMTSVLYWDSVAVMDYVTLDGTIVVVDGYNWYTRIDRSISFQEVLDGGVAITFFNDTMPVATVKFSLVSKEAILDNDVQYYGAAVNIYTGSHRTCPGGSCTGIDCATSKNWHCLSGWPPEFGVTNAMWLAVCHESPGGAAYGCFSVNPANWQAVTLVSQKRSPKQHYLYAKVTQTRYRYKIAALVSTYHATQLSGIYGVDVCYSTLLGRQIGSALTSENGHACFIIPSNGTFCVDGWCKTAVGMEKCRVPTCQNCQINGEPLNKILPAGCTSYCINYFGVASCVEERSRSFATVAEIWRQVSVIDTNVGRNISETTNFMCTAGIANTVTFRFPFTVTVQSHTSDFMRCLTPTGIYAACVRECTCKVISLEFNCPKGERVVSVILDKTVSDVMKDCSLPACTFENRTEEYVLETMFLDGTFAPWSIVTPALNLTVRFTPADQTDILPPDTPFVVVVDAKQGNASTYFDKWDAGDGKYYYQTAIAANHTEVYAGVWEFMDEDHDCDPALRFNAECFFKWLSTKSRFANRNWDAAKITFSDYSDDAVITHTQPAGTPTFVKHGSSLSGVYVSQTTAYKSAAGGEIYYQAKSVLNYLTGNGRKMTLYLSGNYSVVKMKASDCEVLDFNCSNGYTACNGGAPVVLACSVQATRRCLKSAVVNGDRSTTFEVTYFGVVSFTVRTLVASNYTVTMDKVTKHIGGDCDTLDLSKDAEPAATMIQEKGTSAGSGINLSGWADLLAKLNLTWPQFGGIFGSLGALLVVAVVLIICCKCGCFKCCCEGRNNASVHYLKEPPVPPHINPEKMHVIDHDNVIQVGKPVVVHALRTTDRPGEVKPTTPLPLISVRNRGHQRAESISC